MNQERMVARKENMEFFFYLISRSDTQIEILMYNTSYTLVKKESGWENSSSNKMSLSSQLVKAVIEAIENSEGA